MRRFFFLIALFCFSGAAWADSLQEIQALKKEGKFQEAISLAEKALLEKPNDEIRLELASLYAFEKRYEDSLKLYNTLLEKNPKNTDFLLGKARVLSWMGKGEEAKSLFENISPENPGAYAEALLGLADLARWENDPKEAHELYKKAEALQPESPEIQKRLAEEAHARGDFVRLRRHLSRWKKLDPLAHPARDLIFDSKILRMDTGFSYEILNLKFSNWNEEFLTLSFQPHKNHAGFIETSFPERFDKRDGRIGFGFYENPARWISLYGRAAFSTKINFSPKSRVDISLTLKPYRGSSVNFALNWFNFPEGRVQVWVFGVERYLHPKFAIAQDSYLSTDFNNVRSESYRLRFSWIEEKRLNASLFLTTGSEAYQIASRNEVQSLQTRGISSSLLWWISPSVGVSLSGGYTARENSYARGAFGGGLSYRY